MTTTYRITSVVTSVAIVLSFFSFVSLTNAAGVSTLSDVVTRHKVSEASDHTINFTTSASTTITASETIVLTFASGTTGATSFDLSTIVFGDIDVEVATVDQTVAATAGAGQWGVVISDATDMITFTAPTDANIATSTLITFQIGTVAAGGANQIVNPSTSSDLAVTAGSLGSASSTKYYVELGGTFGDSGIFVLPVLSDDQVHIYATVQPELTFALHSTDDDQTNEFFGVFSNSINFGILTSSANRYATMGATSTGTTTSSESHGFRVGTNAAAGYAVTVEGKTLTNGSGDTITALGGAAAAAVPGTEQFGLCITDDTTGATSGTDFTDVAQQGTIAAAYACGSGFAFDDTAAQTIANGNAAGPTSMTFYDVRYLANIGSLTEAGTYTTDLTYIATGTF